MNSNAYFISSFAIILLFLELTELTVNSGYFKAFALSGRQAWTIQTQGAALG